ncbi:hypothetical protein HDU91_002474 [Kappamyces sp. JEL0680]|nr:hypothetical protein HDU91_002474 [Kappamyces sp. JEL0680]
MRSTRCAEIIMLKKTSKWDAAAIREYRLYVKKRLYLRNREVLDEMELGDRLQALQHTYDQVEEDYRELLSKIA